MKELGYIVKHYAEINGKTVLLHREPIDDQNTHLVMFVCKHSFNDTDTVELTALDYDEVEDKTYTMTRIVPNKAIQDLRKAYNAFLCANLTESNFSDPVEVKYS